MIDVIYLEKDKNRCHVYAPPRASKFLAGGEAARDRGYNMQSIGVRARSQWAWYPVRPGRYRCLAKVAREGVWAGQGVTC